MKKIIHITDCHVCPRGGRVVGLDPTERLRQVIRSVNETHGDSDLCVVTGDLTDQGEVAAYEEFRNCLDELRIEYRLLLGNHDSRAAFRTVFPGASVDENGFVQSVVELENIVFVTLDTHDENHAAKGLLCEQRLKWLRQQIERRPDKRVILFMHHPPRSIGVSWFDQMLLANPESFLSILKSYPAIEHIAFGHLHLTTTGHWGGVSFSCNRGTCHRIVLKFGPTEIDFIESEPTYDVILIDEYGVMVHHTAPMENVPLLAREHPTPDGKGRMEIFDCPRKTQQQ